MQSSKNKELKIEVPIIILPIHKRNKKQEVISISYGNEVSLEGGPNLVFLDSRYKNYEFRTPIESMFVEASFLKNNYLAFTGKKNFKHALESLSKIDSSLVLPLRASPQQCTCGLCKKQTIENRCAFWKQLVSQRTCKNSRANATRLISLLSFFQGKKFNGVCETLIVKELVFFDNFHSNQKPPQRPMDTKSDSYQCSTLIAADGFQFKIPSAASWPRVAITDNKVLTQILSGKFQKGANNSQKNNVNQMGGSIKNKMYVPIFREKMKEKDLMAEKNNQEESDPSSSEEIKENDTREKKSMLVNEKAKYYKAITFNTAINGNPLNNFPIQDSPKNVHVQIAASTSTRKSYFTPSLVYTDKLEECSTQSLFNFCSDANQDISLEISAEFPFENSLLSIFWCSDNENVNHVQSLHYRNVSKRILIDAGKIKYSCIKESMASTLELHFVANNCKYIYRVPVLIDVSQNQSISKTFALVVCLDKDSHTVNHSLQMLRSSNAELFFLLGSQEATKCNVESSLQKISLLLKPNDVFHFYYFGHVHHPTTLCTSDCKENNFMGLSIFSLKKFFVAHPKSFVSLDLGCGLKSYSNIDEVLRDMDHSYNNFFFPLLLAIEQENKGKNKRTKKQNTNTPNKKNKNLREVQVY